MSRWLYFKQEEVEGLNEDFVTQLDMLRAKVGFPIVITSGFRTPEKNKSLPNAVSDSAHLKGVAVDVRSLNSHEVWLIVYAAKTVGINRVGIYVDKDFNPVHIHMDVDPEKVQEVIFIKMEAPPNV